MAEGPTLYGGPRRRRYGRILHCVGGRSQRGGSTVSCGGRLPEDWLTRHINSKESSRCITSYSSSAPDTPNLHGGSRFWLMWIISPSWVHFHKVRADDQVTHGLLVKRFTLQVEFGFLLTLKWVPTADNGIADAV